MKTVAILLALVACSPKAADAPTDIPPPLTVIQPQPDDVLACAHLAIIGCPEAWPKNTTCVQAMSQLRTLMQTTSQDAGVMSALTCIIGAPDANAVRKCGDPSTLVIACSLP